MAEKILGFHSISEMLKRGGVRGTLYISRRNQRTEELIDEAERLSLPVSEVTDEALTRMCGSGGHKGAALMVEQKPSALASDLNGWLASLDKETALTLVLDHITDPQNLGAILRSADQFQVDMVILPSRRSAQETEVVQKISSGASAYVPLIVVPNIVNALEKLKAKEFWIYGADMSGELLDSVDFKGRVCIVMGSEGTGMRRLVSESCDFKVRIPAAGHVDSFNVSVAAGIIMYEARRQQGFARP